MELALKILLAICTLISVGTALYNVLTTHSRATQRDHENRQAAELAATSALAIRTQERVTGLEGRVSGVEQRIEKRMDQVGADITKLGSDITKVKDLFTDYLLKQ